MNQIIDIATQAKASRLLLKQCRFISTFLCQGKIDDNLLVAVNRNLQGCQRINID